MSNGLTIPQMIANTAQAAGVPPALAVQVAQQESGFNPNAVGSKGEQGLFQLMPTTAADLGVTNSFDPVQNAQGGVAYLAQLFQQFGDWATALTAFNWGEGNVQKYGAAAAPASTQVYVANALGAAGLSTPSGAPTVTATPSATPLPAMILPDITQTSNGSTVDWFLIALLGIGAFFAGQWLFSEA